MDSVGLGQVPFHDHMSRVMKPPGVMKGEVGPCHHGMARPQVVDGGDTLQFWREAANVLNKQSQTAVKRWPSSLGVGRGANNSSP